VGAQAAVMAESVGGPGGMLGNMHADVLNHVPENDEAKERLLEELKRRAKGAFKVKDMPSCDLLYSKALEFCKDDATLFSNRAMVYLNLGKVDEALKDCESCLKLDSTMVKAYYRKAQSLERLGRFDDALAAIAKGREVKDDPSFATLEKQVQTNKEKDEKAKAEIRRDAQDTANAVKPQAPVSIASMVERKKQREAAGADGEDLSMKGYRTKADGSKTTFFHTEISDEAKALIEKQGFGKPQKLDGPVEEVKTTDGKSTWNSAGTWESKNLKKWVGERLDQWIGAGSVIKAPTGSPGTVEVSKVEWEGAAEIVMMRGKRKRVLDLQITVSWTLLVDNTDEKATGKLVYQDVCVDDDAEIRFELDSTSTPAARPLADLFVKGSSDGLQPLLQTKLQKLLKDFAEL
jgi:Flp pilus assembly protein TadD